MSIHLYIGPMFAGKCFAAGSQIETPLGPVPVESLVVGDRVLTNIQLGKTSTAKITSLCNYITPAYNVIVNGETVMTVSANHKLLMHVSDGNRGSGQGDRIADTDLYMIDAADAPAIINIPVDDCHVQANVEPAGTIECYGFELDTNRYCYLYHDGCRYPISNTSSMISGVERSAIAGKKCVLVKHTIDVRYDQSTVNTHVGPHTYSKWLCGVPVFTASDLSSIEASLADFEIIGIDEAQFFDDCALVCSRLALAGKHIYVAGLDGAYTAEPFGSVAKLIPLADSVNKLTAVCKCGQDAPFTKRKIAPNTSIIDVGGEEIYAAACRSCMFG